ncbi:TPA: hypothetical protein ACXLCK_002582 [Pseudomonas aeruginosa]
MQLNRPKRRSNYEQFRHLRYLLAGNARGQECDRQRSAIVSGVRELVEKHGGEISGASNEDEMTVLDMIEQHEDFADYIADDARAKAKEVHAKAAN